MRIATELNQFRYVGFMAVGGGAQEKSMAVVVHNDEMHVVQAGEVIGGEVLVKDVSQKEITAGRRIENPAESFRSRMIRGAGSNPTRRGMGLRHHLENARGITYLALMFSIVLIGISVSAAARQWTVMVQREKEADLMAKDRDSECTLALYSAQMKIGRIGARRDLSSILLAELTPHTETLFTASLPGSGRWRRLGIPARTHRRIMGCEAKQGQTDPRRDFPLAVRHFEVARPIAIEFSSIRIPLSQSMLMPPLMGLAPGAMPQQPGRIGPVQEYRLHPAPADLRASRHP